MTNKWFKANRLRLRKEGFRTGASDPFISTPMRLLPFSSSESSSAPRGLPRNKPHLSDWHQTMPWDWNRITSKLTETGDMLIYYRVICNRLPWRVKKHVSWEIVWRWKLQKEKDTAPDSVIDIQTMFSYISSKMTGSLTQRKAPFQYCVFDRTCVFNDRRSNGEKLSGTGKNTNDAWNTCGQ
jgi:hypothetical protein